MNESKNVIGRVLMYLILCGLTRIIIYGNWLIKEKKNRKEYVSKCAGATMIDTLKKI